MKLKLLLILMILTYYPFTTYVFGYQERPATQFMNNENRNSYRQILVEHIIKKCNENNVFKNYESYVLQKKPNFHFKEEPLTLLKTTFNRTRILFNLVKPIIKNDLENNYNPQNIETTIQKFLWLKGLCFFVLGIGEEHKFAFAFLYLPENIELKEEILRDMVQYLYPEVLDLPENDWWFHDMVNVMERIGSQAFDI